MIAILDNECKTLGTVLGILLRPMNISYFYYQGNKEKSSHLQLG